MPCLGFSFKNESKTQDIETRPQHFKQFHEMYKIISFNMSFGLMYPNPHTEKFRITGILITYMSVVPVAVMIFCDVQQSWLRGDFLNIVRHFTIVVPFLVTLTKMYLMYHNRLEAQAIIDEINNDYAEYNTLSEDYQDIAYKAISKSKVNERHWMYIVIVVLNIFPIMASVQNLYSHSFTAERKKYMIHDLNIPMMDPEARFETPYFEILFVYMLYCCMIFFVNFVAYDGFYGIVISHSCLKMQMYCKKLEYAMKRADGEERFYMLTEVIDEQCKVFKFVETIQKTFNFWLGMIFSATVVHVCNCMYQITEGLGLDLRYLILLTGTVIHIYLPCRYSSQLRMMSLDTATFIYSSRWEHVYDQRVRKMLVFMIARAQIPIVITAFNLLTFDMELFVSILRNSYSMFTLLRSNE